MIFRFSRSVKGATLILVGAGCNAVGLLADRYLSQMPGIDFSVGLMTGMSLSLMLFGMWRVSVERRQARK